MTDLQPAGSPVFATTHWSVVMVAKEGGSSEADAALEKLCRAHWRPLYAYIRRDGQDAAEAKDLTQEFFARLLERDYLSRLDPQRGKFRSFLLAYAKHFLAEHREKAGAQKRGGGQTLLSLDPGESEEGYLSEPVDELTRSRSLNADGCKHFCNERLIASRRNTSRSINLPCLKR